jgi:hypothetical protein
MNLNFPDRRRVLSAWLVLVGLPGFIFCGLAHICMDGHMAHPPYAAWHYVVDVLWSGCFLSAALIGLKSNLILRGCLCPLLPGLVVIRLFMGSLGGLTLLLELPLSVIIAVVAFRSLRRSGFDPLTHTEAEQMQHKKSIKRRLVFIFLGLFAAVLLVCAAFFVRQLVRVSRVPRIIILESSLPFTYELPVGDDASVWFTLPNNKRVALWREDSSVYPEWGERPYSEPSRIWTIESPTSKTSDRVKSYMQMGLDSELSATANHNEFSLFVDNYCIAWPLAGQTNYNDRIILRVRHAQESELDYLRKEYGKWPLFD